MKFLVVIRCPNTGQEIPTGVVTDVVKLDNLPTGETDVHCPACGWRHTWSVRDALLAHTPLGSGDSGDFLGPAKDQAGQ
jgi:hypothetical protein